MGGEFFSKAWLAAAGKDGPLADSVALVPTAPVYVKRGDQGKWAAYCEAQPAAQRTLLRLPDGKLGFEKDKAEDKVKAEQTCGAGGAACDRVGAAASDSRRSGAVRQAGRDSPRALALMPNKADQGAQVLVDMAAAMDPNAGPVAGDTAQPITSAAPIAPAGPGSYRLAQPVTHHRECPGNYIIGRVLNAAGGPVAGVRLTIVDQWNNRAEAVSKSGASDFGNYDFMLNAFANRYTVTVVDGSGRPIRRAGYGGSPPGSQRRRTVPHGHLVERGVGSASTQLMDGSSWRSRAMRRARSSACSFCCESVPT